MTDDTANHYPFNQTPLATVLMALGDAIAKRKADREYWSSQENGYESIVAVIDDEIATYERFMNDLNGRVYVIAQTPFPDATPDDALYSGNPLDPADGRAPSHRDW
jgi:hypothetical protein